MDNKCTAALVTLVMGALWAGSSLADTYKWVDGDGNIVYSQTKPPGGNPVETLKHYTQTPDEEALPVDERKANIKANCKVARYNKAVLQTPAKVVDPDAEGDDILLTDSQKENRLADATSRIDVYCS